MMRHVSAGMVLLLALVMTTGAIAQDAAAPASTQPATSDAEKAAKARRDNISYLLGLNIGAGLKSQGIVSPNLQMLMQGIADAIKGKSQLTPEKLREAQTALQTEMQALQARLQALAKQNEEKGNAFLEANKNKEGVQVTASGLQYQVVTPGQGASPTEEDTVNLRYSGQKIDGKVFLPKLDSKSKISAIKIKGLIEALKLMKPGAQWRLFIPPDLAFGPTVQSNIGPNETLVVDLELVSIEGR